MDRGDGRGNESKEKICDSVVEKMRKKTAEVMKEQIMKTVIFMPRLLLCIDMNILTDVKKELIATQRNST